MSIPVQWGVAQTIYVVLPEEGGSDFVVNPTLASGDFKLSKDGGTDTNLTSLPTVTPSGGTKVAIALSATESEFIRAVVTAIDTATKEWKDNAWDLHTPLADGAICGKITSGTPSTTSFTSSNITGTNADQYNDAWVTFRSGTCVGATKRITAFTAGSDTVTCEALPAAPAVGDVYSIVNGV